MPNAPRRHAGRPYWVEFITARLTPTIKAIVLVLLTVFLFYLFVPASHDFLARLIVGTRFWNEPWQAVTGLFIHFSPLNLIFSLIGLWFIGADLERTLGRGRFLTIFLGAGILANVAVGAVATVLQKAPGDVGCSLAIPALFVAFGRLWKDREVSVLPGFNFKAQHVSAFWVIFAVVAALAQGALPYVVGVLVAAAVGYLLAAPGSFRQIYDGFRARRLRQRYRVLDGGAPKRGKPRNEKFWN